MAYNAVWGWLFALLYLENPSMSGKFLTWLGRNSLIIYLWHLVVIRFFFDSIPVDSNSAISTYLPLILIIIFAATIIPALGYEAWLRLKARAMGLYGS
jgi:fucose 4-O-acetylase-like acetyltransferase